MHSKSENTKSRCNNDANEVFDKVIESIHSVYQDAVVFRRGGLYIDPPGWTKKKKSTIYPKNTDDKCFQYAVTIVLNYEEI